MDKDGKNCSGNGKNNNNAFQLFFDLEIKAGKYYKFLADKFPEDSDFWNRISAEEAHHGSLVQSMEEFISEEEFTDLFSLSVNCLSVLMDKFEAVEKELEEVIWTKKKYYEFAMDIEESAFEVHFQRFMSGDIALLKNKSVLPVIEIFKNLNRDDKNHYQRIMNLYHKYFPGQTP